MTRITTKFGFHSTADEVVEGIDLTGKNVIVTGGASGIGIETARTLAKAGADVTIAARSMDAGKKAAGDITASTGNKNVSAALLDLADLDSVKAFAESWKKSLHILVNNAGVMALPDLQTTPKGMEMQFAVNHLGHFALTLGLHDSLAAAGNARVVCVSSSGHFLSPVIFDDINFSYRRYDPGLAYGQSKTANILFAVGASARWAKEGITANALTPGAIATNLQRHVGGKLITPPELQKTPQQGASTSVLLAVSPLLEGIGGRYFDNCSESEIVSSRTSDYTGVAPYALDVENAERLWETSLRML